MVALIEQAAHHLAGGVVGIGDKVEGSLDPTLTPSKIKPFDIR
jgi:hypothetical protein